MSTEIQRLLALVHKRYNQRRDVAFYAEHLGVGLGSLGRLCRRELGISTKRVITGKIIARAEDLLPTLGTAGTAHELGFHDSESFRRFLKRHTGITATALAAALAAAPTHGRFSGKEIPPQAER